MTHLLTPSSGPPVFQIIASDIVERIRQGEFLPGQRMLSIAEVAEQYSVSVATAQRAVTTLADRGIIRTIPRKGVYVAGIPTPPEQSHAVEIERLVVVESTAQKGNGGGQVFGFAQTIADAVVEASRRHCIPLRFEYVPIRPLTGEQSFFEPKPTDGLIVLGGAVGAAVIPHLVSPGPRVVTVDTAYPGVAAVLTDNYAGMRELALHLHAHGHRRVTLAAGFAARPNQLNATNENERRDGMVLAARSLGMETFVEQSGDWARLFATLESDDSPTVVAFTRDLAAVQFIQLARDRGLSVPEQISVAGFDDWARGDEETMGLTTVHVDLRELGRRAVTTLLDQVKAGAPFAPWVRLAPRLVCRRSVAAPRGAGRVPS